MEFPENDLKIPTKIVCQPDKNFENAIKKFFDIQKYSNYQKNLL